MQRDKFYKNILFTAHSRISRHRPSHHRTRLYERGAVRYYRHIPRKKEKNSRRIVCDSCEKSKYVTELVSRVLYALRRSNHLSSPTIADRFKPCGSATMKQREQLVGTDPEYQGVASDRVYSGSMLP